MWSDFFIGLMVGMVFLFLPGTLIARSVMRSLPDSIAIAPAISIGCYAGLAVLYGKAGIPCSWTNTFIPLLCVGLLCIAMRIMLLRHKAEIRPSSSRSETLRDCLLLALYLLCGCGFTLFYYVLPLDGPCAFNQGSDIVHHLNSLRAFSDTGNWSSLQNGFYPSAWHEMGAMIISFAPVEVPLAANVLNTLFIAVVFPSGMFFLFKTLFQDHEAAQWFGVICIFAFPALPWKLIVFGPLYPYLASLCIVPAIAATFIMLADSIGSRSRHISLFFILCAEVISALFLHTGSLFVLIVFLTPYCFQHILRCTAIQRKWVRILCAIGFVLLVIVFWTALFESPSLAGVVWFNWPALIGKAQALANILLLSYKNSNAQILLGIIVVIGVLFAIRSKRYRWLVVSYALMCVIYFFDVSTDGFVKHYLAGFWYSDQYRVAANAAFFAMPLACLGMCAVYEGIVSLVSKTALHRVRKWRPLTGCGIAFVLIVLCFYPSFDIPGYFHVDTAFGGLRAEMKETFTLENGRMLTTEEYEFSEEVAQTIEADSILANVPMDGSTCLTGLFGIRTLNNGVWHIPNAESATGIVRLRLNEYAEDADVQQAVRSLGLDYVIQLDQGENSEQSRYYSYGPGDWIGIESIDEDTPGFRLVLQEGDMRLYEILDLAAF